MIFVNDVTQFLQHSQGSRLPERPEPIQTFQEPFRFRSNSACSSFLVNSHSFSASGTRILSSAFRIKENIGLTTSDPSTCKYIDGLELPIAYTLHTIA